MGLEVREVPVDYRHPTWKELREQGYAIPDSLDIAMKYDPNRIHQLASRFDHTWEEAFAEWEESRPTPDNFKPWIAESYPAQSFEHAMVMWMEDHPRDPIMYRPEWPEDAEMGIQIWETVSEGSPCSPVFKTDEDMVQWLMSDDRPKPYDPYWLPPNYSEQNARAFVTDRWVPSLVISGGQVYRGIESAGVEK